MQSFSWLAEELVASEERLCAVKLVVVDLCSEEDPLSRLILT